MVKRNKPHDWIGKTPIDWQKVKLKYAVNLINEKITSENKLIYIGLENIEPKTGRYIESKEIINMESNSNKFNSGDILFGKLRPYLSKCIIADFDGKGTTELLVLRQKEHLTLNRYIKYVMLNEMFIDIINSSTYGAKMPRASWDFIAEQVIPLPTLDKQYHITDFLDQKTSEIDSLIADKERLIELLEEKRQAIITEAVTKGLNPDVKMKDSGVEWIGEIPEHWKINKIKYNTYVKGRIGWQGLRSDEFIDEGPHLVTGTDFVNGIVNWCTCYHISEKRYNEAPAIQLNENDLLITKDGTIGKVAIVRSKPEKAILNSGIFVTRPLNDDYLPEYMYWILTSHMFDRYMKLMVSGSTIKHLYQETFVNFSYVLPSITEQKRILEYLKEKIDEVDFIKVNFKKQISKLKEYRQSLIYEAVTGKIDVGNYN